MPISGRFYTTKELQEMLGISRQGVNNLARRHGWDSPHPGLYASGPADATDTVDAYLHARARQRIKGQRELDWDDTYDIDCPVAGCDGICLELDDGTYRCAYGHSGPIE